MKPLTKFDDSYFLKYNIKPVKIMPYNPKQKEIANKYLSELKELLESLNTILIIRGSTAFEIAGKGDVEVGVYVDDDKWSEVLDILKKKYGKPDNFEEDYARFNLEDGGFEVEIIVLKGYEAKLDRALTLYLMEHSELLKEYKQVKEQSKHSKREYQIQKNKFFVKVSKMIPDNYLGYFS